MFLGGRGMTNFRSRPDGSKFPVSHTRSKPVKMISKEQIKGTVKHVHIHGLTWSGYVLNYANDLRHKSLNIAVQKYGKGEVMQELAALRTRYNGNTRLENVIDSDMAYILKGKFEED